MISSSELVWNRRDDGRHCGVPVPIVPTIAALLLRTHNQEQARSKNAENARAAEHPEPTQSRNAPTPNPQPRTSKKQDEESARADKGRVLLRLATSTSIQVAHATFLRGASNTQRACSGCLIFRQERGSREAASELCVLCDDTYFFRCSHVK